MLSILDYIHGKRKTSPSGWISFNAPCCIHNGETPDKRMRGGVKFSSETDWSYHCFNCGFTSSFKLGYPVSYKTHRLLTWMGAPDIEIQRLSLESLKHRSINQLVEERKEVEKPIHFDKMELPKNARLIQDSDTEAIEYLRNERKVDPWAYPYMVDPDATRQGVIIPYTYNNEIVGYTTRYFTDRKPKYLNHQQPGYVFGTDLQQDDWQFVIVVEGIFDSINIKGVSILHNEINDQQAAMLRKLHREVIIVPDQDKAGLKLIDSAIKHNFAVSIPPWDSEVKDVDDAVKQYGKLATLLSIIENKKSSKVKIELAKKALERKVK